MKFRELRNTATLAGIVALVFGVASAVVGFYFFGEAMWGNILAELAGVLVEVFLIFLVLDWIVRRRERHEWQFAYRAISQRMAVTFVDVMRLLYVASSDLYRQANANRYSEFIETADQHFGDLRSHIESFAVAFDVHSHQRCRQSELRLSWMLTELRRSREPGKRRARYFKIMQKIGIDLHEFFMDADRELYEHEISRVEKKLDRTQYQSNFIEEPNLIDEVVRFRLDTQSQLLAESADSDGERIFTIMDDIDQKQAIPYFILDYLLLRDIAIPNAVVSSAGVPHFT